MNEVSVQEAAKDLAALIELVKCGQEVLIAEDGVPVACLTAPRWGDATPIEFFFDEGKFKVPDDFNALPPEFESYT